jgi:hypothetical protein
MKIPPEQVQDVDRPELNESFVDSLALSTFDGAAARLTFCVTRMQDPQSGRPGRSSATRCAAWCSPPTPRWSSSTA